MARDWPDIETPQTEIPAMYARGFGGVDEDRPELDEQFADQIDRFGGTSDGEKVAYDLGFAGKADGELVISGLLLVQDIFPEIYPGPAQTRGDCVSHSACGAASFSALCETTKGRDEITGQIEVPPTCSAESELDGVYSSEIIYHWRGKRSDGWRITGAAAALTAPDKAGLVVRQNYRELGLDLTRYSGTTAGRWGATPPPEPVRKMTSQHNFTTASVLTSPEQWADHLKMGYGVGTDGGEAWQRTRNADGVAERSSGGWAHSMFVAAADLRESTKRKYPDSGGLILVVNSWGRSWIKGGRTVRDFRHPVTEKPVEIPHGSFWAKVKDLKNRRAVSFSGGRGYIADGLPDLSPNWS